MRSTQNPYEQFLKFVAEAIIRASISLRAILTTKALKIAYEMIEGSKE